MQFKTTKTNDIKEIREPFLEFDMAGLDEILEKASSGRRS
jgi:hypothetical protein